jgi:hypothetical protein
MNAPEDGAPVDFASGGPLTPCPIKKEMQVLKGFMMMKKEGRRAASLGAPVANRMSADHRNRFIRFGLSWRMRFFVAFAFVLIPMQAMSLKDFDAKPAADRSAYVADFIDKMTTDLRAKNPELAQSIRTWFAEKAAGRMLSEGMERLNVELGAVEIQAQQGKTDLSKVQLESVIVWVVKQKFPPPSK